MKYCLKEMLAVVAVAVALSAEAWQQDYSCRESAVQFYSGDAEYELTMVREWTVAHYRTEYESWDTEREYPKYILVEEAHWTDGGDDKTTNTWQKGACWFYVDLERGKDYVLSFDGVKSSSISAIRETSLGREFALRQLTWENKVYRYIAASDWKGGDPETVRYYFNVGGYGLVGTNFTMKFEQKSIYDVVDRPGTISCPIEIDASGDGSRVIDTSLEQGLGASWTTAYVVDLKADETYQFTGTYPSDAMTVRIRPLTPSAFPGTVEYNDAHSVMTLYPTENYRLVLLVMPDDAHWKENVGGGTLSWHVGPLAPPEVVEVVTGEGSQSDVDFGVKRAEFSVAMTRYDDDSTLIAATVRVDNVEYAYVDNGGGEMVGEIVLDGVTHKSHFQVQLSAGGELSVDGSLYAVQDGSAKEFWFAGSLAAGDPDDFSSYNPLHDSAKDMGLVLSVFKDESAGSELLVSLWTWAVENDVSVSQADTMVFTPDGSPVGLLASAFLLNCEVSEKAVEEAVAAMAIVQFCPGELDGGIVLASGKKNGERLGNGVVEVRTCETVDGEYDVSVKQDCPALFYRAYLILRSDR